jgi:hypothetical protein
MIALLDLEWKTARLFAHAPHVAEILIDDQAIPLVARNEEEVLEHLGYILELMKYRYDLSEQEIDALPLLIVYLEEFIDLKDHFKHLIDDAKTKEEHERAEQKYARLVHCIKKIARRGLKVHIQLLMCAQADYRDEDLQEALINVTSGMSFCVRPSAARAAGFQRGDLLQRNAASDQLGQAVCEMPDCKDLILAPDFPLRELLKRLTPVYKKSPAVNAKTPVYSPVNASVNDSQSQFEPASVEPRLRLLGNDGNAENEHEEGEGSTVNVNSQTREMIKRMADQGITHRVIAKTVKLDGRNYPTYKQICRELGISVEREA